MFGNIDSILLNLHIHLNLINMQSEQESNKNQKLASSKFELAMQYFSNLNPATAIRILRRWIAQDPLLLEALMKLGYNKHCHLLTPIQVRTIHDHLGKP